MLGAKPWGRKKGKRNEAKEELQALKVRTQALAARLSWLESRIRQIEHGPRPSFLQARVDPDKCLGCGLCAAGCRAGAIMVGKNGPTTAYTRLPTSRFFKVVLPAKIPYDVMSLAGPAAGDARAP